MNNMVARHPLKRGKLVASDPLKLGRVVLNPKKE